MRRRRAPSDGGAPPPAGAQAAGASHSTRSAATAAAQSSAPKATDLPRKWLLRLAEHLRGKWALALSRTCKAMRGVVLEARDLKLNVLLPLADDTFDDLLQQVCAAHRASRRLRLLLSDEFDYGMVRWGNMLTWEEGEAGAAHLLSSAAAELGGTQLPHVVGVEFDNMELESPIPRWLSTLCPNVKFIGTNSCQLIDLRQAEEHDPTVGKKKKRGKKGAAPSSRAAPPSAAPPLARLELLALGGVTWNGQQERCWAQLRALPALSDLYVGWSWPTERVVAPPLSTSLQALAVHGEEPEGLGGLPSQFPALRRLHLPSAVLDDAQVAAVLGGALPHLDTLQCEGLELERSHAALQARCPLKRLFLPRVGAATLALLPLGGVEELHDGEGNLELVCGGGEGDAGAVEVVLPAARRWGAGAEYRTVRLRCDGDGVEGLVASLPLVGALQPRGQVRVGGAAARLRAAHVRALGRAVRWGEVRSLWLDDCRLEGADAWAALLPSVAGVRKVGLSFSAGSGDGDKDVPPVTEAQLVALCKHDADDDNAPKVRVQLTGRVPSKADALCKRVLRAAGRGPVAALSWTDPAAEVRRRLAARGKGQVTFEDIDDIKEVWAELDAELDA